MASGLRIDKLYFYLLTSGTSVHQVYQAILAYDSMSNPNVGDYKGRIGLSPPAAYPSTVGYKANKGSLQPRHHVYAIDYSSSVVARVIHFYQGPSTRASATGTDDEPRNK